MSLQADMQPRSRAVAGAGGRREGAGRRRSTSKLVCVWRCLSAPRGDYDVRLVHSSASDARLREASDAMQPSNIRQSARALGGPFRTSPGRPLPGGRLRRRPLPPKRSGAHSGPCAGSDGASVGEVFGAGRSLEMSSRAAKFAEGRDTFSRRGRKRAAWISPASACEARSAGILAYQPPRTDERRDRA